IHLPARDLALVPGPRRGHGGQQHRGGRAADRPHALHPVRQRRRRGPGAGVQNGARGPRARRGPMSGNPRQRYLLYALGAVALIALWHYLGPLLGFGGSDEVAAGRTTVQRPATDAEGDEVGRPGHRTVTAHQGAKPGDRVAVLRMADLDRVPGESKAGRDPWRFVDPPPPPPPPPHVPTKEELEAQRRAEE